MYEVEKIVGSRYNPMTSNLRLNLEKEEFQVKWVGYELSLNTWEPEKNLVSCQDLVEKYKLSRGKP